MGQIDNIAPAADPSMEDILASIRRILADGEEGGEAGAEIQASGTDTGTGGAGAGNNPDHTAPNPRDTDGTPVHTPPPAPPQTPPPNGAANGEAAQDVFVLDQSMLIEEPAIMRDDNEQPPHDYSHLDAGDLPGEPLLAAGAAAAATASLGALARVVNQRQTQVYRNGPTLEDMVREEIRPLVKGWLDENLAPMVERLVRAEILRVTGK
jgi:cell pole-organizing protein PopZ